MAPPRQIGPFEIAERLGAGGMGEVWKARDSRLNRLVALKLLPEMAMPAARERLQREALAIASLNHPHICTLYEAGEDGGRPYLALELLEGETLHARLLRGAATPAQVIQWGIEIADALEAAHVKGILHRDLKPGNIIVTPRGAVKVLDFGLAQMAAGEVSDPEMPTAVAGPLTSPGTTLGTLAYMSPEQARGEATDARSDIFSLGTVLYECATGKPAFSGRTAADLTAAVLTATPPAAGAGRLDEVIAQCLEKDPGLRYQNAADVRASLRRLQASASATGVAATVSTRAPRWRWLGAAITAAVLAAGAISWWRLRAAAPAVPSAAADLQLRQLTFTGQVQDAAISPDGKFLAYVNAGAKGTSLHLLSTLNGSDTQIMPPAPGCCSAPSFSPDGSTVYFTEGLDLDALPVLGGAVRAIASNVCSGAAASPDGSRIAFLSRSYGDILSVANADGTQARVVANPTPAGFVSAKCWTNGSGPGPPAPAWSPDGREIAVESYGVNNGIHLELINAATGAAHMLGPQIGPAMGSGLAWAADGSGILLTTRMPVSAPSQVWEITEPGGQLMQLTHDLQGYSDVSVAPQAGGALALVHSEPSYSVWTQATPEAAFQEISGGGASLDGVDGLAWTRSGDILSVRSPGGRSQFWREGSGGAPAQISVANLPADASHPSIAPDGEIVFQASTPTGQYHIWRMNANGTGLAALTSGVFDLLPQLVKQGAAVAYISGTIVGPKYELRLWTTPLTGGEKPRQIYPENLSEMVLAMPGSDHVLVDAMDTGHGHLEAVPVSGGPPVAMARQEQQALAGVPDGSSHWVLTPDGHALAIALTSGGVSNLWAFPLAASPGAPRQITHFTDLQIAAYAFAHDGRLALSRGEPNSNAVIATGMKP